MTVETFFEKFGLITDTPNAVEKMRELVVGLAVRGRLAPQSDDDTPATKLVAKAIAYSQSLPDATKRKLLLAEWELRSADLNGKLPPGWAWACNAIIGDTSPRVHCDDDARVAFAPMNLLPTDYRTPFVPETRPWKEIKKGYTHFANGDVAIAKITPCFQNGKGCVFSDLPGGVGAGTTELHVLRPYPEVVHPLYALLWFKSPEFVEGGVASFTGTAGQQRVSNDYFRFAPFPLPPLGEQKRIVAKVDELMALCDRLEAEQAEREAKHAHLARAALARFAEAPTLANLTFLFHDAFNIDPGDLRKSILTLAVRGKLVSQDPNEGTGRELVALAAEIREETIRAKKLRRKRLDEPSEPLARHALPESWGLERFANLVDPANTISYGVLVPGNDVQDGVPFVRAQDLSLFAHPARPNKTIAREVEAPYARTRLSGGEILLCVVGSIGKLGIVPASWAGANIARAVARIKPVPEMNRDFLLIVLQENSVQTFFTTSTRTLAQPTLNVGLIEQTPIPVPPLAEQRRIVAKVDHLMALVDQLEAQLGESQVAGGRLMEAVVAELTNPETGSTTK